MGRQRVLQELPRPFTALVWENAALISGAMAEKLGLENGDVIACQANGLRLEAPSGYCGPGA